MPLLSLPNELLLQIADSLNAPHTFSLLLTNHHLHTLLTPHLLSFTLHEPRYCVTALYLAATTSNSKLILHLLTHHPPVRITDHDEIRRSVTKDNTDKLLQLLLDRGPHSIIQDRTRGGTALHWAADYGHISMTQLLLSRGMPVNVVDPFGRTALQWAASEGQTAVVRVLVENGADVEARDYDGVTALHRAVEYGCDGVVRVLLEKGADIDTVDRERATPLHWAVATGNWGSVGLLLEGGADGEKRNRRGVRALDGVRDEVLEVVRRRKEEKGEVVG